MPGQKSPEAGAQGKTKPLCQIHATIRMHIPAQNRHQALAILHPIIEMTSLDPGCISCRLYQGVKDEQALLLEQRWASEEDLQRHLRSQRFHTILLVVEMASEVPEIRFDTVSHSHGIDVVEQVRA
jgi:quinol monooxygenase YgiN